MQMGRQARMTARSNSKICAGALKKRNNAHLSFTQVHTVLFVRMQDGERRRSLFAMTPGTGFVHNLRKKVLNAFIFPSESSAPRYWLLVEEEAIILLFFYVVRAASHLCSKIISEAVHPKYYASAIRLLFEDLIRTTVVCC